MPSAHRRSCSPLHALCSPLQLLVNNAGVTDGWKELGEVTAQDMLDCFTVNTIGGCQCQCQRSPAIIPLGSCWAPRCAALCRAWRAAVFRPACWPRWLAARAAGLAAPSWDGLRHCRLPPVHPPCLPPLGAGPLLVTQQLHKQGVLGGKAGSSMVANMTSKASWQDVAIFPLQRHLLASGGCC